MSSVEEFCADLEAALLRGHDRVLESAEPKGFIDERLFKMAIARPWTVAGGHQQFPDPFAKAAAIAESIAHNSPFVSGNKRTASLAMPFVLLAYDYQLRNQINDRIALLERAAAGLITVQDVRDYIARYAVKLPP